MLDFMQIRTRMSKRGLEVYPAFKVKRSSDLMIRGSKFYGIWDETNGRWSRDWYRAIELIDNETRAKAEELSKTTDSRIVPLYLVESETKMIDAFRQYVEKQSIDSYSPLDAVLTYQGEVRKRSDFVSRELPYPLKECPIPAYTELTSTLYSPSELHKLEWAVGAIASGNSYKTQKFIVLYGPSGAGKSTYLNIIEDLFQGYTAAFSAKTLGQSANQFSMEVFKDDPLVAIDQDGDLSRLEDNTRLNSLVAHDKMTMNEKFKSQYQNTLHSFLFIGTNSPVRITDAKSGIIRRLIDVTPSGKLVKRSRYDDLVNQIKFELGGIAKHCIDVYMENPRAYDNYIPTNMIGASNTFFNFIAEVADEFVDTGDTTLNDAWGLYKAYCTEANVPYPLQKIQFKEELKNYFEEFKERDYVDGKSVRNHYIGFIDDKFITKAEAPTPELNALSLKEQPSILDTVLADSLAQYANDTEVPVNKWAKVKTKLRDIDTSKLHYVKLPENHIVIDFDLKNEKGEKSYRRNLDAARRWPATYSELSKSGKGIHLHYIYTGDPSKLSRLYDTDIEIKVFTGDSSLRRKLTACNNLPIRTLDPGPMLPLKEEKVITFEGVENEKHLRALIRKALKKKVWPNTKPNVDYIYSILEEAYKSGMHYDITDLREDIEAFAAGSTHQADAALTLVTKMHFKSEESTPQPVQTMAEIADDSDLVFFDVEVYPNVFLICYKHRGKDKPVISMLNPKPAEVLALSKNKLVGFNCRGYDNHVCYARILGYNNEALYRLSKSIIDKKDGSKFSEAYNFSYTDIYDFASAGNKMSLKKYEIKLGIHHQEMPFDWNQPIPEDKIPLLIEYCSNDVISSEATFDHLVDDWTARQILADIAGKTVNDTTNTLTTSIIFGSNKHPQNEFRWRDMSQPVTSLPKDVLEYYQTSGTQPIPFNEKSLLPYYEGYTYDKYKRLSIYRGEEVGEGGYVYAEPGMYTGVVLLDIASMHPHSAIAECVFGPRYTLRFKEIVDSRIYIKHNELDRAKEMLDGKLRKHLEGGRFTPKVLSTALKTPINSVYGLTSAGFENPARDPNNIDNIVAKRGALTMIDIKNAVQELGYKVVHIKTDSIKIANADDFIINFVMEMGKKYGYTFEHEATYEKMCLVNDAVYIAKYAEGWYNPEKESPWTATGAQFAQPFVYKTLFSQEKIEFKDLCETKSVQTAMYLDKNERLPEGEHEYHFVGRVGSFIPILPGCDGGELLRVNGEKYAAVVGTKGYRWLESEVVEAVDGGLSSKRIDYSYHKNLVDKAVDAIAKYGDFEWFIS